MDADEQTRALQQVDMDNIRIVRLQFTDLRGQLKGVSIPVSQCEKAFRNGIWFDGSSIEGCARIDETDLLLVPDPATYTIIPWSNKDMREARFICDVREYSGKAFAMDPRSVLKKVLEAAHGRDFTFFTGPEMEFWLFKSSSGQAKARFHDKGGYFDLCPADNGVDIRREIILALEKMGYLVEASHHEVAKGQHEISFRYGPALSTADRIATFRHVARTIALKYGVIASFIPKPEPGMNGNAMHVHASLYRNEKNVFFDPDAPDEISDIALAFIGGLLAHAKGLCRIANPTINSYKRLTPGYEAPCTVSWSTADRSSLVRIPAARGDATRIELRNPDGMGNPYLLLAGILAAGMDGIRKGLRPPECSRGNRNGLSRSQKNRFRADGLPTSLANAQECLLADQLLCDTLGEDVVDVLTRIAETECNAFSTEVHPWEIHRYFQAA
ncbi:MAG: type I glutamate--ammonia ligase [Methanomicrobiales archaeon HGW-Methanomicrobiales-3]|jgi:glutamine synthetase|nr:MAG: type I glutamate--ammonia ligase [Methanomicrobiales archaeon HGW-Methanomicrobiales-3]